MSDQDDRSKSDSAPQPDRTMENETPGPGRGGPRFGPVGGNSGEGLEPGRIVGEPFPVPGEVEAGSEWPDRDEWALPTSYGEDAVVALVRDPWWMFVYWELTEETRDRVRAQAGEEARLMIQLEVDGRDTPLVEVEVPDIPVGDWYVPAHAPRHTVQAHMGYVNPEGTFFPLGTSRGVPVPAFEPVPPLPPREGEDSQPAPYYFDPETGRPVYPEPDPEQDARTSEELLFEASGGRELENAQRWREGRTRPVIWRRRKFGGWHSVRGEGSGSGSGAGWGWEMEEWTPEEQDLEAAPQYARPPSPSSPSSPIGPVSSPSSPFGSSSRAPWARKPDPEGGEE